jgi:sucrose-6-phosphate hydrolase SacC (GH32 family)
MKSIRRLALVLGPILWLSSMPAAVAAGSKLQDKTLVVWAAPADLSQHGGSALTIEDAQAHFDGIVFAELTFARWMPGNEYYHRTRKELECLRLHERKLANLTLGDGNTQAVEGVPGDSCELALEVNPASSERCGVRVRAAPGGEEQTLVYYDSGRSEIVFDATQSGVDGRTLVERAPLAHKPGEKLKLRVFVDRSVVEVYANDRQAIARRVYPTRSDSLGLVLFAQGGRAHFQTVRAWEMVEANPY